MSRPVLPEPLVQGPVISHARSVVMDAGSAHWAAGQVGSSVIHLTENPDEVAPLCGFVFPLGVDLDVFSGYLPSSWKYGYMICLKCEGHVAVDRDEVAEPRRPLSVDELLADDRPGRHAIEVVETRRIPVVERTIPLPNLRRRAPRKMVVPGSAYLPGTSGEPSACAVGEYTPRRAGEMAA